MNDYKLDFSYRFDGQKYNLKDINAFNNYNWNDKTFLNAVVRKYENDMMSLRNLLTNEDLYNTGYNAEMLNEVEAIFKQDPKMEKSDYLESGKARYSYGSRSLYFQLLRQAVKKTKENAEMEDAFQKWLLTRPGVVSSWNEYVENYNKKKRLDISPMSKKLTSEILSNNTSNSSFRKILEHNRPDKFNAGEIVELKNDYKHRRGYDPYYYKYEQSFKSAPRVGTVLKKEPREYNDNYGTGSRLIRVLWFTSGEETRVPEKALSLHN